MLGRGRRALRCEQTREYLSARHDGDDVAAPSAAGRHLASCQACQAFAAGLGRLDAIVAAEREAVVADMTSGVLAAVGVADTAVAARRSRDLRVLVGLAGVVQVAVAVLTLVAFAGPVGHLGRDLGAVQLALGVGFLLAAWQPSRTVGVLPVAAVATVVALAVVGFDLAAGQVTLAQEVSHIGEVVGVVALWRLSRRAPWPMSWSARPLPTS